MMTDAEPRLPPELEREAFEVTAELYPAMIPTLLRVSRRVLLWIEPMLYKTLQLDGSTACFAFLEAIKSKPAAFFAAAVRSVHLHSPGLISRDTTLEALRVCTGTTRLIAANAALAPEFADVFTSMALKRFGGFMYDLLPDYEDAPCLKLVFSGITHFELFEEYDAITMVPLLALLAELPALTHMALNGDVPPLTVEVLVTKCIHLEILVILSHSASARALRWRSRASDLPSDTRIMLGAWHRWYEAVSAPPNFWTRAEEFVERKRSGNIAVDCFWLDDEEEEE